MKICIVNLKRKPEKMEYMKKQLQKTNKEYYFFEAVDGENDLNCHTFKIADEWFDPYTSKAMTKGEIGCALSHFYIWKNMYQNNVDRIIVLEDDIVMDDNFDALLDEYLKQIDQEYDMLYLGRKAINKDKETFLTDNIIEPKYSYWTCGYLLTLQGSKKLVESNYTNALIPVDEFLSLMFEKNKKKRKLGENKNSDLFNKYNKYYNNCSELKALSVNPYLILPRNDAFLDSDTYNSMPLQTNPFKFDGNKLIVLTVGTDETDGLVRFRNYCSIYGFYLKILGLGQKWLGGEMEKGEGGGQKINLLKEELDKYSAEELENTLILFTDCYDVIVCGSPSEVVNKFKKFRKPIIFSAEKYCWPDKSLESTYEKINKGIASNYKFLNSGGFIGWAKNIHSILSQVEDSSDDQLFYTQKFLKSNDMLLDNYCEIFQTLNGVGKDLEINFKSSRIRNRIFDTEPIFLHGNGPMQVKLYLNMLENYTGSGWNNYYHSYIDRKRTEFDKTVFVAHFSNDDISKTKFNTIDYPKHLITVQSYRYSSEILFPEIYKKSILDFYKSRCDYYFHISDNYIFTNKNALTDCLIQDKSVVGPLFRVAGRAWSNFWGDVSDDGYYKRSFDYFDILERKRKGCWNIPYLTGVFLVKKHVFVDVPNLFDSVNNMSDKDLDMIFCENLRNAGIFMYLVNYEEYGKIYQDEQITLYSFDKKTEWEEKYLHPKYIECKNNLSKLDMKEICSDAFNFPLFSKAFCSELILLSEKLGKWSPGENNHHDPRLGGNAYENVPTQDIHLKQLGLDKIWEQIVHKYIAPVAELLYNDYQTKGTNINFVVKYSLDGQKELKPHHDGSVYTINIALNNDFEGGGCRFIRQKVDCVNKEIGVALIHPGRLTHYHKGLPITSGKRYILVSFVN